MHPVPLSDPPHRKPACPAVAGLQPDNLSGCMYEAEQFALLPGRLWDRHKATNRNGGQVSSSSLVRE
jgi:hypothetical protein